MKLINKQRIFCILLINSLLYISAFNLEADSSRSLELTKQYNSKTGPNDWGQGSVFFLDRHNIDCGPGNVLQGFHLIRPKSKQIAYEFACIKNPSVTSISYSTRTPWNFTGKNSRSSSNFLDRHNVECKTGYALQQFKLIRKGPKHIAYHYRCVKMKNLGQCISRNTPFTEANKKETHNVYLDRQRVFVGADRVLTRFQLNSSYRGKKLYFKYSFSSCKIGGKIMGAPQVNSSKIGVSSGVGIKIGNIAQTKVAHNAAIQYPNKNLHKPIGANIYKNHTNKLGHQNKGISQMHHSLGNKSMISQHKGLAHKSITPAHQIPVHKAIGSAHHTLAKKLVNTLHQNPVHKSIGQVPNGQVHKSSINPIHNNLPNKLVNPSLPHKSVNSVHNGALHKPLTSTHHALTHKLLKSANNGVHGKPGKLIHHNSLSHNQAHKLLTGTHHGFSNKSLTPNNHRFPHKTASFTKHGLTHKSSSPAHHGFTHKNASFTKHGFTHKTSSLNKHVLPHRSISPAHHGFTHKNASFTKHGLPHRTVNQAHPGLPHKSVTLNHHGLPHKNANLSKNGISYKSLTGTHHGFSHKSLTPNNNIFQHKTASFTKHGLPHRSSSPAHHGFTHKNASFTKHGLPHRTVNPAHHGLPHKSVTLNHHGLPHKSVTPNIHGLPHKQINNYKKGLQFNYKHLSNRQISKNKLGIKAIYQNKKNKNPFKKNLLHLNTLNSKHGISKPTHKYINTKNNALRQIHTNSNFHKKQTNKLLSHKKTGISHLKKYLSNHKANTLNPMTRTLNKNSPILKLPTKSPVTHPSSIHKLAARKTGVQTIANPLLSKTTNTHAPIAIAQKIPYPQVPFSKAPIPIFNKKTPKNDWGNGSIFNLDRHEVNCAQGNLLQGFHLIRPSPKTISYEYSCTKNIGSTNHSDSYNTSTPWSDTGKNERSSANFLDRHFVLCKPGYALQQFKLMRKGKKVSYNYRCARANLSDCKSHTTKKSFGNKVYQSFYLDRQSILVRAGRVLTNFKLISSYQKGVAFYQYNYSSCQLNPPSIFQKPKIIAPIPQLPQIHNTKNNIPINQPSTKAIAPTSKAIIPHSKSIVPKPKAIIAQPKARKPFSYIATKPSGKYVAPMDIKISNKHEKKRQKQEGNNFCKTYCAPDIHSKEKKCWKNGIKPCYTCQYKDKVTLNQNLNTNSLCKSMCNSIGNSGTCKFFSHSNVKTKKVSKRALKSLGLKNLKKRMS